MTLPKNAVMNEDAKRYLFKCLLISTCVTVLIFAVSCWLIVNKSKEKPGTDLATAQEMRKLNNDIISAQAKYDAELKRSADSSKAGTAALSAQMNLRLDELNSNLTNYKKQHDAKISSINSYSSDDLKRAFADLEAKYGGGK